MPKSFTRLELYNSLWANTMRKFAESHGVTAADIRRLATDADLPLPGPGYWTLLAMGRQVDKTPLHPNPNKDGVTFVVLGAPKKKPKSKQASAPKAEVIIEEHTSKQGHPKPERSLPEKPKEPVTLTRQELYDAVWRTAMVRLGERYGITGNGLAKICDRLDVPYPPRGYWAQFAVGKAPPKTPLPVNAKVDQTVVIRPSSPPVEPASIPEHVSKQLNSLRSTLGLVQIPERLSRPHPVISKWIEERREEREKAKANRIRGFYSFDPGPFTDTQRRQNQILDALFKALERAGGRVSQDKQNRILVEHSGEQIELRIREKQKQIKVPLTDSEKQDSWYKGKDSKRQTVGTGFHLVEFQRYLPDNLPRSWLETDATPFEQLIPQIVSTVVVAGPLLAAASRKREEAERQRREEEHQRYLEREAQKLDANRFRYLTDAAERLELLRLTSVLIKELRETVSTLELESEVGGQSLSEWINWAEDALVRYHPLHREPKAFFEAVSLITNWNYPPTKHY